MLCAHVARVWLYVTVVLLNVYFQVLNGSFIILQSEEVKAAKGEC